MINQVMEAIKSSKTIGVIAHKSPDGDSLGSAIGLYHVLKEIHGDVKVFRNDEIPPKYRFLDESEEMTPYKPEKEEVLDLLFVLDCGHPARLVEGRRILDEAIKVINIDHHMNNPHFGDINIIDVEISSTCELIYDLVKSLGIPVNQAAATAFYTGMVTDTGSFKYSNTNPKTLRVAAEILALGVDKERIYREVYQNRRLNEVRLLGEVLNTIEPKFGGNLAFAVLSREKMKKYGLGIQDLDELIEFIRDIEGVEVSVVLKEKEDGGTKIGLRSKGKYKVNEIAKKMGGGGHEMAAGASVETSLSLTEKNLLLLFQDFFQ